VLLLVTTSMFGPATDLHRNTTSDEHDDGAAAPTAHPFPLDACNTKEPANAQIPLLDRFAPSVGMTHRRTLAEL
jgi:hypothetical protein